MQSRQLICHHLQAQRAIDHLEQEIIPKSVIPPLLPTTFDGMSQFRGGQVAGTFSFGGLGEFSHAQPGSIGCIC
jgi:hypothetical protein